MQHRELSFLLHEDPEGQEGVGGRLLGGGVCVCVCVCGCFMLLRLLGGCVCMCVCVCGCFMLLYSRN